MDNTNNSQNQRPRKDVSGCNNPFWGHRHTEQSKWKDSQHHVSMDEFLSANPSVKEYIKVLAQSVIKEEIDKLVWRKQNQRLSIPI